MNLFNSFFNRREAANPAACTTEQTQRTAQSASFGAQAVQVNSPTAALQVSAWYRASEVLANTMSMLVMEYQKKNDRAHGGNYSIDNDARGGGQGQYLNYLLQVRPNPTMDATQFWKQMTLRRFYDGNAVAYIERDTMDNIAALWVCTSASLIRDTEGMKYNLTYNTPGGQRNLITDATEVIHWRNTFSNDCGLTGIGTLKYAAQTLSLAATNDKQARENAAKGGKQKLLLREDTSSVTAGLKKLNKEQKTKQRDDLQEAINNNQDVLLMSGLMDVNVISQDAAQMQLLEARKFDVPQVARFTGVPPSMLMDNTNNTYKAPEQATQDFLLRTISPMARSLETEFNAKLLGPEGYLKHRFHFNEELMMQLDPKGRADLYKVMLEIGALCSNEIRAKYDLPAIEGGDRHFISTNLQAVDAPAVAAPQQQPQGQPTPQAKQGEEEGEDGQ